MIGIYQDKFINYLKNSLNNHVKITSKNIITECPWCEYGKDKNHYHLYISLEAPIFHCFHATCEKGGSLRKLIKKIEGKDISNDFIDQEKLSEITNKREIFIEDKRKKIIFPNLKESSFLNKSLYLKKRLKFANIPLTSIKGLVFDIEEFLKQNQIPIDPTLFRIQEYLHANFIGFVTENNDKIIFRNIDDTHTMRYFKYTLNQSLFLDYYKLPGNNPKSKKIILAEGVFDIFSENYFDVLNLKNEVKLYASVLSSKYASLIHSLVFHEQIFKPDIVILSDNGIPISEYEKLRYFNDHIINTLTVYYNKTGKDFADTPVIATKHIISNQKLKNQKRTKYKK